MSSAGWTHITLLRDAGKQPLTVFSSKYVDGILYLTTTVYDSDGIMTKNN
jgi:hypothetical protein